MYRDFVLYLFFVTTASNCLVQLNFSYYLINCNFIVVYFLTD